MDFKHPILDKSHSFLEDIETAKRKKVKSWLNNLID